MILLFHTSGLMMHSCLVAEEEQLFCSIFYTENELRVWSTRIIQEFNSREWPTGLFQEFNPREWPTSLTHGNDHVYNQWELPTRMAHVIYHTLVYNIETMLVKYSTIPVNPFSLVSFID